MSYRFTPNVDLRSYAAPTARWQAWGYTPFSNAPFQVGQLTDLSGNGNHLAATANYWAPLAIPDAGWGVPGVWFQRSSVACGWGQLSGTAPRTFITVLSTVPYRNDWSRFWEYNLYGLLWGNPAITQGYWQYNGTTGSACPSSGVTPTVTPRPDVLIQTYDGTTNRLVVNGANGGAGAATTYTHNLGPGQFTLGDNFYNGSYQDNGCDFMFHELVALPLALTVAQSVDVNRQFQTAYRTGR